MAKASDHGHLAERQGARAAIDAARTNPNKDPLRTACLVWICNERKLHRLYVAMQWQQTAQATQVGVVSRRVGKISSCAGKKPLSLLALLNDIEQAHPWSRDLASHVAEVEKCLASSLPAG